MASIGQYQGIDITPGSDQEIQAQIAAIDAGTPKPVKPITPTDLTSTTPISVPAQIPGTAMAGFQGQMETYLGGLQNTADASKQQKDKSGRMLADALFSQQGEADLTNMLYGSDDGVDDRRAELDDINQQILQEQEGLRREIEAIQDNAEGMTRGAVAGRIDETRRRSLRTQADLAVVQLAKQGRFDSAKAIADRAIAVQLEKQKQTIDTLKFLYEENKDQFNKDEQRAFEVAQKEREQAYEASEYRLRAEFDQKIKEQDPLYQLEIEKRRKEINLLGQPSAKALQEMVDAKKSAHQTVRTAKDKMTMIDALLNHSGLNSAVGPTPFSRTAIADVFGAKDDFVNGVAQITSQQFLDMVLSFKSQGGTLGQVTEREGAKLQAAATLIANAEIVKNNKVVGYDMTESQLKAELNKIKQATNTVLLEAGASLIDEEEQASLDDIYNQLTPFDPAAYFTSNSTPQR